MTGDPGPKVRQWLAEGLLAQGKGNFPGALLAFKQALSMDPGVVDAWANAASLLRELGRSEEALAACERALALDPLNDSAHCTLGCLKEDARDHEGALETFTRILERTPDHFLAHFHLGAVLFRLGRLEASLAEDDKAIALCPTSAPAHMNRGYTLMKLGRLEASERALLQALELDPGLVMGHWNLGFLRLLQGRYAEAWDDYAWRWRLRDTLASARTFSQPRWTGERFDGRTLLVWAEQGFGDSIQFARYLPMVKARGGRVIFQVQPALLELMTTCPGPDLVQSEFLTPPPFDLQIPLMELPQIFRTTLDTLPRVVPYLTCPEPPVYQPAEELREALREDGRIRIGLAWSGNPNQKDNPTRSLDPGLLAPLAQLPNVSWFSLQKYLLGSEERALPSAFQACDLGPRLATFADTAFVLDRLHLLISVDTAVAHLAGALARPGLILLSYSPDWRWHMEGEQCPWYPSFRLYRQPKPGDWEQVVRDLLADLA